MDKELFKNIPKSQEKQASTAKELEAGERVFNFLNKINFFRTSNEQLDEWFQKNSYEDFINYLTRLNGIIRGEPIKQRSVDGGSVEIAYSVPGGLKDISYLPPITEEKEKMMKEVFNAFKDISNNEDRALLIYYALQVIHLYSDGNGRTGRLLYELISDERKKLSKEKLEQLLNHDQEGNAGSGEGRDVFAQKVLDPNKACYYINREVVKEIFGDNFLNEYGKIYYAGHLGSANIPKNIELSLEERNLAQKIIGEGDVPNFPFRELVILKLLQENNKLADYQFAIKRLIGEGEGVPEDVGKKILGINDEEFEAELTAKEIKRLIEIHKNIKRCFVKKMIDIFKYPDTYQFKMENGRRIPIKNFFHN